MGRWRRRLVVAVTAAAAALIVLPLGNASAQRRHDMLLRDALPRDALLRDAADALARGDASSALRGYEAAATLDHAAEIEIGIVRSLMLGGHYRRALAFAAHTAQAHPDEPEGARLYAQLLDVGGQGALAARTRPLDMATTASASASATAAVAPALATGMLIDAGRHALLPLSALSGNSAHGLRDGHGRALSARIVQRDEALGLALLRLDAPPTDAPRLIWAARDAFAGSPAHAIAAVVGEPPWPRLRSGFLGPNGLGIDLAGGAAGGAVLSAAGRVIGVSVVANDGVARLMAVSALRRWLGALMDSSLTDGPAPLMPLDAVYETALRATVSLRPVAP